MVHPLARKFLPILNFCIASAALTFQVCVLYPWHTQLEHEFHALQEEQKTQLANYHHLKMETIKGIETEIKNINLMHSQPKQ